MKVCTKCGEDKIFFFFCKDGHKKSGYTSQCKACQALSARERRAKNPERSREITKAYRKRNIAKERSRCTRYNKKNPEVRSFHAAKRRAAKLQATPDWADQQAIKCMYTLASKLNKITGSKLEVDHIVPLQGKNVCGLHVEHNLQLLDKKLNVSKSNKF